MPHPNGDPTPDDHEAAARGHLAAAQRHYDLLVKRAEQPELPPYVREAPARRCQLQALLGIGQALLTVAGQLEAIREHGIYRPEDGR